MRTLVLASALVLTAGPHAEPALPGVPGFGRISPATGNALPTTGYELPATRDEHQDDGCGDKDVIFIPTPQPVVDAMLRLAQVTSRDVVFDLGSGDGRIPITAAKIYGARGVGVDICVQRILESNALAKAQLVESKVRFLHQDLFKTDIREATVVTMYLLPRLNVELIPKLNRELAPGTRVVSHHFDMSDDGVARPPKQRIDIDGKTIYMWTIPIRPEPAASRRR